MSHPLFSFGIPSLDELIRRTDEGNADEENLEANSSSLSVCLSGSDGSGKSVLALHMAARYRLQQLESGERHKSRVIYFSLDISHRIAEGIWDKFALGCADRVIDPFDKSPTRGTDVPYVGLKRIGHDAIEAGALLEQVEFLDLRADSHGDDWGYLNRLLAALQAPPDDGPRHLLIIDAVDGLEVLAGERDAFGERRDRPSRVTQILRAAATRCHIVFVSSEGKAGRPEEYLADLVVKLGTRDANGYSPRCLEIVKVRGDSHVRGRHDFTIRPGPGSSTGEMDNPDDPAVLYRSKYNKCRLRHQSYVYVFHSLHWLSRRLMESSDRHTSRIAEELIRVCPFGIRYLDEMLPKEPNVALAGRGADGLSASAQRGHEQEITTERDPSESTAGPPPPPSRGLLPQESTAIIGEEGTHKAQLSRAFLAGALRNSEPDDVGVAVLLTSKGIDLASLSSDISKHIHGESDGLTPELSRRIICRRLEIHHVGASTFLHIVRQLVRQAQRQVYEFLDPARVGHVPAAEDERRKIGWRIRFVLEDWSAIRAVNPEIANNPQVLPHLLFFFYREAIPLVVIADENASVARGDRGGVASGQLLRLADRHIYTWRVEFFGQSRVAVRVSPPHSDRSPANIVRELRRVDPRRGYPVTGQSKILRVNPEFDLYRNLESGAPEYVPTHVHLCDLRLHQGESGHAADATPGSYFQDVNVLLSRLVGSQRHLLKLDEPSSGPPDPCETTISSQPGSVVQVRDFSEYASLREFAELQGTSRFDYTLVMQVDEYWAKSRNPPLLFKRQVDYLTEITWAADSPVLEEDPFLTFQPRVSDLPRNTWRRLDTFETVGYDLDEHCKRHHASVVKVPFSWDFGFLMCHGEAWKVAVAPAPEDAPPSFLATHADRAPKVADVWTRIVSKEHVPWREFLEACWNLLALLDETGDERWKDLRAFGLSHNSRDETLVCLVFEIWASEIPDPHAFVARRDRKEGPSLVELVDQHGDRLFVACLLLKAFLQQADFDGEARKWKPESAPRALAERHWYSTVPLNPNREDGLYYRPTRLPGNCSMRGDWFLSVARGSRSYRIGERAIDILTSHRGNIVRLQDGHGLPVRGCKDVRGNELWTPICFTSTSNNKEALQRVSYSDLRAIGSYDAIDKRGRHDMQWIWRSRIKDYDRQARIWQRWLCTLFLEWPDLGFDKVCEAIDRPKESEHWNVFSRLQASLLYTLGRATLSQGKENSS